MSDEDAILWALDTTASVPSTITVAIMLEGGADPDAVTSSIERLTRRVPRFRDRVTTSPVATAPPRWEPDPDFALSRHLVRADVSSASTVAAVLRRAETVATSPFDLDRPLWQMQILTGRDGGTALLVKLHHSFADGMGLVKMAAELFDFERRPASPAPDSRSPDSRAPDSRGPGASSTPWLDRIEEDLALEARHGLDLLQRLLPWAVTSVRDAATDPGLRAAETLEAMRALRSLAEAAARPGSPILVARATGARLGSLSLPLPDLRDSARRAGGTVNDVFLAGLLGGLRHYHAKHGCQPASVRIGVPISARSSAGDEPMMGNRVAPMLIRAPLQLTDPVERIRLLHQLVTEARHHPAVGLLESAAGLVRRFPGSMQVLKHFVSCIDVLASNVPGSPADLFLGGARVERIIPIGPRGGSALNLTLLSHVDAVHIGVNMDPVAIADPDLLLDCLSAGFDETLG